MSSPFQYLAAAASDVPCNLLCKFAVTKHAQHPDGGG